MLWGWLVVIRYFGAKAGNKIPMIPRLRAGRVHETGDGYVNQAGKFPAKRLGKMKQT
jgi:hypothetical protein